MKAQLMYPAKKGRETDFAGSVSLAAKNATWHTKRQLKMAQMILENATEHPGQQQMKPAIEHG